MRPVRPAMPLLSGFTGCARLYPAGCGCICRGTWAASKPQCCLATAPNLPKVWKAGPYGRGVAFALNFRAAFSMLCGLFLLGPGAQRRRYCRPFLAAQATVLLFYMALTGFPVSVVRAGVIYLVALLGYALVQPSDLLTSLGIAALAIGFQNGYAPVTLDASFRSAASSGYSLVRRLAAGSGPNCCRRMPGGMPGAKAGR